MCNNTAVSIDALASGLKDLLKVKSPAVVIAHARPDGDTVGSCAALCAALNNMGYMADWICADKIPLRLQLLDSREDRSLDAVFPGLLDSENNALVISLDTAEYKLMGDDYAARFNGRVDVKLDHHPMGTAFAALNYTDGDTGSCGELCFHLIRALCPSALTPNVATALFAAISSDTGSFKYSNASPATHRIAAELMEAGGDSDYAASKLYGQRTPKDIAALGLAFGSIRYFMDGRVALLTVTNAQKDALGLCDDDLGELASLPRDILGVEVGVTVKQVSEHPEQFKVSMRSNGANVSAMCAKLGGGGHVRASGALVTAQSAAEAEAVILGAVTLDGDGNG